MQENEYKEQAWGVEKLGQKPSPFFIARGKCGDEDVKFEMLYCGICHTDVHFAENDLGNTKFPVVPGHELIGKVVEVGSKVTNFKVGDNVGVGCIVDSCLDCSKCKENSEQYCENGMTMTYNSDRKRNRVPGN